MGEDAQLEIIAGLLGGDLFGHGSVPQVTIQARPQGGFRGAKRIVGMFQDARADPLDHPLIRRVVRISDDYHGVIDAAEDPVQLQDVFGVAEPYLMRFHFCSPVESFQ